MLQAIHHITINVLNKEKTFWFYGEVLGLEKLNEADMGDHYIYYYQLPGETKLELIEYKYETPVNGYEYTDRGVYRHFALRVDNIQALYEKLIENKVKVLEGPNPSEILGVHFMLVEDPNGVEVEFVQPL